MNHEDHDSTKNQLPDSVLDSPVKSSLRPPAEETGPATSDQTRAQESKLGLPGQISAARLARSRILKRRRAFRRSFATKSISIAKCDEEPHGSHPAPLPVTQIEFAELSDGSLVELIEDPGNPGRTLLAVCRDGEVSYMEKLEYRSQVFVPLQRKGEILKRIPLPRGVRPYKSVGYLLDEIRDMIRSCIDLRPTCCAILAHFVLATWLVDQLPVAPYVSVVGLPQSGKTTLLKLLSLFCRRSLLTADITSAAFYQACAQLTPTLLIDEAGTHASNRTLCHLLRMGTTRDVVAMRKNQSFHAYGAKVICWLEPPNDPALNSRCILILMTETNRTDLEKLTNPNLQKFAIEMQQSLLQFRFDTYKGVQLAKIPGSERLRPRARDLLTCLTTFCVQDLKRCKLLLGFFELQNATTQEPLSPAHNAVLLTLFSLVHQRPDVNVVLVGDLTAKVNEILRRTGEKFCLQPRKIGAIMTSLGFSGRLRTNTGWTVWLHRDDQERVHKLARSYGMERLSGEFLKISLEDCPICQKFEEKRQAPSQAPGTTVPKDVEHLETPKAVADAAGSSKT